MNLDLSTDGVSVSTDPEDAKLAGHVKATAESVRDLATYVAGETRQPCHQCGKTRACRPLALQDERGEPTLAPVCAGCQETLAEQRMEMARQRARQAAEPGGDGDE